MWVLTLFMLLPNGHVQVWGQTDKVYPTEAACQAQVEVLEAQAESDFAKFLWASHPGRGYKMKCVQHPGGAA